MGCGEVEKQQDWAKDIFFPETPYDFFYFLSRQQRK
jgi:hypothetical protein